MQPDSPALAKLAQLPQPALEALLDSDELQAASENTVIAAVAFWLKQEGGQQVTREQRQRIAYKLRLSGATPWYLTRILVEEGHWLHSTLSSEQKVVLTTAAHSPAYGGILQAKLGDQAGMNARLFGDAVKVSWWKKNRPASSIRKAESLVKILPGELWEKPGVPVSSQAYFYNGILWSMFVHFQEADAGNAIGRCRLGAFFLHSSNRAPVAFSAGLELVGVAQSDTIKKKLTRRVRWNANNWGFSNMLGDTCTSLEDAAAKLAPFTHPDGKVHIKGTVTKVH
jgi:hypothetical protein